MSVVLQGNGSTTSSITIATLTLRDTRPQGQLYSDNANVIRIRGDGGYDYVYRRGINQGTIVLDWTMLPYNGGLKELASNWNILKGAANWCWLQTPELDTVAKAVRTNITVGSSMFARDTALANNPQTNVINGWIVWLGGPNAGKKLRVVDIFSDGSVQMETALTLANGDQFLLGWPVRITSPFAPVRIGNRNDFFSLQLTCEVAIN